MKNLTLAALLCGAIVGLALGASRAQGTAAAPSKSTTSHPRSGMPKATLPKTSLPKSNVPKTTLPKTNLPGAKAKSAPAKTGTKITATKTSGAGRATYNGRYASYRRPVRRYSAQQMAPTPDRYREIQDALAARGYLKTPSSGVWDADSMDAMQRFQKDQNLEPTGKLTARSLTALGLGSKTPEATASLNAAPATESTPLQ